FRHINPTSARIILMEGGPRILPAFPEDLSAKAEKLLVRLGVEVVKNIFATDIDAEGVTYKLEDSHKRFAAKTVLWAGGVTTTEFGKKLAERTQAKTDRSGRISVNPDLSISNYTDIFIVGDQALAASEDGKPLPGVAQVAMQGGAYVARTIRARVEGKEPPRPFHYLNKGDMAVIGRAAAVANIFGLHLSGLPAWLVWLFIHLIYLVEFQSRVLVFIQWGFEFITFSRGARLITGTSGTDSIDNSSAVHSHSGGA
ncbi:MAG TPA: FAD-dependent oxidoreductase, partial [Candidatus Eremiobacteraceae bacterium]|nr:FAD-dependent oxidoreductase [Candidatus Eremiobacteraceae bacterium]